MNLCTRCLLFIVLSLVCATSEDHWVWSPDNNKERAFHIEIDRSNGYREKYNSDEYGRKEREPTTKRPSPSSPQNEVIEDYTDDEKQTFNPREYPYRPLNYNSGPSSGFNNYQDPGVTFSQLGNLANGILVGPGGPTGIIGRPQQPFPPFEGGFPLRAGPNRYPNKGGAIPVQFQIPNGAFPFGFGRSQQQGNNIIGSLPIGQVSNGQYPLIGQVPQGVRIIRSGQFPAQFSPAQYSSRRNIGSQFPGIQYHTVQSPERGPLITEGYGLSYLNMHPAGQIEEPFDAVGSNSYAAGSDYSNKAKLKLKIVAKNSR